MLDDDSGLKPLIPEGEYQLKFQGYSTKIMFGGPKLILKFSIVDFGEFNGITLYRYYGVKKLIGKVGNRGLFKAKQTGDFLIEYFNLFPDQSITRLDRIPMERLSNVTIVGKVRTVLKNNQQKKLPEQVKYSAIGELLRTEQ